MTDFFKNKAISGRIFLTAGMLMLFLLPFRGEVHAQIRIDSLDADLLVEETINGEPVRKLLGNTYLRIKEENVEMYCDSAYQYRNRDQIRAYGNIQINTENEKIWADSLVYFMDIDFSQLRGRVIIEADSTTLFGNSVDYRFGNKVAHFIDQIRLEDPGGVLTANSGFYYREADSAVFRGQVQLRDSTQYIEGDSLFSNRDKQYYEMHGDIYAKDGDNNSTLKGNYLEADSTGRRLLTGNAWLMNVERDNSKAGEKDSTATRPEVVTSFRPDSLKPTPDSGSVAPKPVMHRVNKGETLFSIAQSYKVTVDKLRRWNNLAGNMVRVGQNLLIDPSGGKHINIHTVEPEETLFSISQAYGVEIEDIKIWNNLRENTLFVGQKLSIFSLNGDGDSEETLQPGQRRYTIRKGDNLFKIAREQNTTIERLKEVNELTTNNITVGQSLILPDTTVNRATNPSPGDSLSITSSSPSVPSADSLDAASPDTTHIRAIRILSVQNRSLSDTSTVVNAYENVRIWSRKFSAISDTSRYDDGAETFELWSQAKTWHEEVQLSGPYIKVYLQEGNVDRLEAYPRPFAVQQDTSLDRLNQIKGDTLNAYFQEGNLSEIHVFGGSHLLRYTENEQGEPDGAIDMTAPSTRIFFEGGELVELKSKGAIDGSYLPQSEQTANRQLEGFIWTPDLRPSQPREKMIPRFPPITDDRPFTLPARYVNYINSKETE